MKTIKFFILMFLGISLCTLTSCGPDEPKGDSLTKPVYGTDFAVSISGQKVTFAYSGSATNVQWFYAATEDEALNATPLTGKEIGVVINLKGEYVVICAVSNGGDYLFSDAATFSVTTSDLSYLESGIWKALSGGKGGYNVTFKLDVAPSANEKNLFWHKPLDFWGDKVAGASASDKAVWGPWGGTSIYDWGGTPEVGSISFDCENMTYRLILTDGAKPGSKTNKDGSIEDLAGTFTGKFSLVVHTRDMADQLTGGDGVSVAKWSTIFNGQYSDQVNLDENTEWATITFNDDNGRFPMDKGRIGEGQYTNTDLHNVDILYADENGLVVNIKRSYDGFLEDTGEKKADACWLLYNYIIEGKEYNRVDPVEPIDANFTKDNLVGEWKYNAAPYNWIGWKEKNLLNEWTSVADITATGWATVNDGWENARFTFNNDGSCSINGTSTTYTVSNGVITFAAAVSFAPGTISFNDVTEIHAIDVSSSTSGIWLGLQNEGKLENSAINLVKTN